jgi:hypothetical protein
VGHNAPPHTPPQHRPRGSVSDLFAAPRCCAYEPPTPRGPPRGGPCLSLLGVSRPYRQFHRRGGPAPLALPLVAISTEGRSWGSGRLYWISARNADCGRLGGVLVSYLVLRPNVATVAVICGRSGWEGEVWVVPCVGWWGRGDPRCLPLAYVLLCVPLQCGRHGLSALWGRA